MEPEQRDLVKEGHDIRQDQDHKRHEPATKSSIQFTSLAQSLIPNLTASKILGRQIIVHYVPDTFFILHLAAKLFRTAKRSKFLSKDTVSNIHSFMLFTCYVLMYHILAIVDSVNPGNTDIDQALRLLTSAGYNSVRLPTFMSHWINGLGEHLSPELKRRFLPYLPELSTDGVYFDNYFYHETVAHLLPNFKLLQFYALTFTESPPTAIPNAYKPKGILMGNPLIAIGLTPKLPQARTHTYKVPGAEAMTNVISDSDLVDVVYDAFTSVQTDPVLRYLSATPALLAHLKEANDKAFNVLDVITLNGFSPIGTGLTTIPMHHVKGADTIAAVNVAADDKNPLVEKTIASKPCFRAKVMSRTIITNGDLETAVQTPLIRITQPEQRINLSKTNPADPNHAWYSCEMEFQTSTFTLTESHSFFRQTSD